MDSFLIFPIVFISLFLLILCIACVSRRSRYSRVQRRLNGGPVVVGPTALPVPARPDIVYCPNQAYGRAAIPGFSPDVVVVTNYPGESFQPFNCGGVISYCENGEFFHNPHAYECGPSSDAGFYPTAFQPTDWAAPPIYGMPLPPEYDECVASGGSLGGGQTQAAGPEADTSGIGGHNGDGGGAPDSTIRGDSGGENCTGSDATASGGGDTGGGGVGASDS